MQAFFQTDPLYREKFADVWLWTDWPGRNGRPDCGIDLVAQQANSDGSPEKTTVVYNVFITLQGILL